MGLDSVELILSIEEEFGIEFPDEVLDKITTVGQIYDYLREQLRSIPSSTCFTQRLFYRLRRAIMQTYSIPRDVITLDMKLSEWMPMEESEEGWPYVQVTTGLEGLEFEKTFLWLFKFGYTPHNSTMRDLVYAMITAHNLDLAIDRGSDEELWLKLVNVFVRQLNLSPMEIRPESRLAKDLGID